MLALVPEGEVCEWKLRTHAPLATWVDGAVALVGDACHPTLPVRLPPLFCMGVGSVADGFFGGGST